MLCTLKQNTKKKLVCKSFARYYLLSSIDMQIISEVYCFFFFWGDIEIVDTDFATTNSFNTRPVLVTQAAVQNE